jgi:hypothetical protein
MNALAASCRALCFGAAGIVVLGCGSSAATPATEEPGFVARPTSSGTLLYVIDAGSANPGSKVYIVTYPQGTLAGSFRLSDQLGIAACSDSSGNVFIIAEYSGNQDYIYEYAHGGTAPIATLSVPQNFSYAFGCARDAVTGNLAIINDSWGSPAGNVEIFPDAQGNPTTYAVSNWSTYEGLTYDGSGNLFVDGGGGSSPYRLAEFPSGATGFQGVSIDGSLDAPTIMQSVGQGLSIETVRSAKPKRYELSQVTISGSSGTVTKTIAPRNWKGGDFIIFRGRLIADGKPYVCVGLWAYPRGGKDLENICQFGTYQGVVALAISPAPK